MAALALAPAPGSPTARGRHRLPRPPVGPLRYPATPEVVDWPLDAIGTTLLGFVCRFVLEAFHVCSSWAGARAAPSCAGLAGCCRTVQAPTEADADAEAEAKAGHRDRDRSRSL